MSIAAGRVGAGRLAITRGTTACDVLAKSRRPTSEMPTLTQWKESYHNPKAGHAHTPSVVLQDMKIKRKVPRLLLHITLSVTLLPHHSGPLHTGRGSDSEESFKTPFPTILTLENNLNCPIW